MAKSFNSIKAGWKNSNTEVGKKKSFKDIKSADYDFGIDESRINSFLKSSKEYFDNVESETSSVNYNNAQSKYSSNQDKMRTLGDEARMIRAYYNANKGKIDATSYNNMMEYLDTFDKSSSSVLDYYRKNADTYSKFKTEAEYNDAVKVGELYDLPSTEIEQKMGVASEQAKAKLEPLKNELEKLNTDIRFYGRGDRSRFKTASDYNEAKKRRDALEKQISDLKGKDGIAYTTSSGQNITWSSLYKDKKYEEDFNELYQKYSALPDWAEKSSFVSQANKDGINLEDFGSDPLLEYIYGDSDLRGKITAARYGNAMADSNGEPGSRSLYDWSNDGYDELTDKEKELITYLYYADKDAFNDTLSFMSDKLIDRHNATDVQKAYEAAQKYPIGSSLLSLGYTLGSGVEFLGDTLTDEIDGGNQMAAMSSSIRQGVSDKVDWEVGDWDAFDFLYNTGMSMADSVVSTTMFGGAGGVALGLSAAAQSTNDALNRGMSKGQAFTSGLASGIFEGIFESWSIGAFGDLTKNLKRADFRNLAKYIGKNMWNNAKEETLTEIANIAYDTLINGDFSQYETTIRQYMASGMSESDAKKQVAIELGGQIAEAGASGALMGFGFGAIGSAGKAINTYQSGKLIKDAGETRNLVDLGKSLGEGTESYEMANKITDKSKAYAIGQLLGIATEDIQSANKGDIVKSLERKGYDTEKANNIADLMLDPESTMFENFRGISAPSQTYNDIINNPNSTVGQRNEAYEGILRNVAENRANKEKSQKAKADSNPTKTAENVLPLASNYVEKRTEQLVASGIPIERAVQVAQGEFAKNQGKMSTQTEKAVESKFESNPEGKDINTANEKIIASKKLVASDKDNMAFMVTYDDGTTEEVDANNISFGNEGEALVYSAVMDMNVPVGVAETLIGGYKGNDVKSAGIYINGVREAFVFGKYNQEADLNKGTYASALTEEQRSNAFKLGRIYANEKAIADMKAIVGESKPTDTKKREGKLHFEGDKLSLKSVQDASIENLKVLTMAIGKDIHIYESYEDKTGKRVYKNSFGEIKSAPNGYYNQADGSIWIDLNAGNNGEGIMMYTVAHELTHFIKQWSPTKFKALADFLVEQYGNEGVSVADLVREQQAKAKRHGRKISYDVAFEEMVADSMEAMLTDGKVIKELAKKDKGLFDKIKSWIDNMLRRLNKEYKNYSPESVEGQKLLEMKKTFTEVQKLFTDALTDASDNFAIRGSDKAFVENYLKTQDVVYNLRAAESHQEKLAEKYTTDASIDLETLQDRYAKIIGIWEKLGGELNSKFLNEWNNKVGKDRAFTIFKAQSGYKYNVELSSMCKKGVPLFEAIDTIVKKEVMNELKTKTLGKAEKEILYDILKNHNFEIPCAICYVEQARQREGVIINDFLDGKIEKNAKGKITKYKLGWNDVLNRVEKEMKKNGVDYTFRNVDKSIATDSYAPADIVMDEATQDAFYKALKKVANAEIVRWNRDERKSNQKERRQITDLKPQTIKEVFKGTLPSNLKIFKVLFNNPSSRFKISRDLLYSSATTLNLANAHNDLYSLFNSQGGVSGYKTKQAPIVYWGDILGKSWRPSTVRKEGGIRNQSNSDFQMYTLLDQAQMYIDFSAKGYYLQAYTKVLAELKLFGLSRGKINASLIPQVIEYKNADGSINWEKTMENAGLDENGNPIYDDFEGINHTEAFMLIEDAEYSKNICGICIGYSDNHIRKLLDDNRVQQIIGFHDKTDNPEKRYRGAKYAKNYNGLNEAVKVKADGTEETVHIGFNQFVSKAEKMFKFNKKTETFEGAVNHNGKEYTANDIPRLAADLYLEMCAEKDYRPAYNDFSSHKNYYKLLADFGLYDSQGNYAPHQKVQYNMPDKVPYLDKNGNKAYMSTETYIKAELQKELKVRDSISEALADTSKNGIIPQFVERVNELHSDRVTADMDDSKRAEVLRKKEIKNVPIVENIPKEVIEKIESISSWEDMNKFFGSEKNTLILKLASEFGVFKGYSNEDINISFEFSKNNFRESYHKQKENYENFAKMFSVFDGVINNAVGIEIHKREDYKPDVTLNNVYVLISVFEDGDYFVPVKLEVKEFKDKQNTLYVAISLQKIKKTEVSKQGNTENGVTQNSRSATINVADLMRNVNPLDTNFTKYFPNELLTEAQRSALDSTAEIEYSNMDKDHIVYSVREEAPPKKTETVYKLMKLGDDGKLYPLFIDGGSPVELGVWYNADSPSFENLKDLPSGYHLLDLKTGKTIVSRAKKPSKAEVQYADNNGRRWMFIKDAEEGSSSATRAAKQYGGNARFYYNVGINGSGSVSEFALRPGWHAGSLPVMEQIGNTSMRNIRADNFVWVEGEISYDIDYQKEAESNPSGENDIPFHIPKDGAYIKGTSNFVTKGMTWYIAGAFKANRIIGDREARKIVDNFNENIKDADAPTMNYDFPRNNGRIFNAETMSLEEGNEYEVRHWERARDTQKQKTLAPDDSMPIRFSERDSKGNTLSKEQQEFFKDSKVRDDEGRLIPVYHGTPNKNVNVFSYDYVGTVGGKNHGYGFYFTANKNEALLYAQGIGEVKESYINITNPIYSMSTDLESKLDELFERLPMYAKNTLKAEYGNVDSAKQYFREYISKHKNGTFLSVFPKKANIHPEVFNNWVLANMGYDGIVYEEDGYNTEYVVFQSNQSKLTSNTNPTSNPDMRYSDRVLMGSLFSGGGTLEAGLVYQMLDKEFAVEFNKQIASVYTDNHGKEHMFVGDVRDFNSKGKQNVFYLHASPVCKNFSSASHSGGETTLDITTAQATARVLEEQMPQVFTVENVKRYIGSEAYNIITNKLDELGYTWDVDVYKASDYGNATKRERMIIRAVKSGELPAKPQKVSNITSWGEATRDLWETDLTPSYLVRSKIEAIKNTPSLKGVKLTKLDKPLLIYDTTKGKQVTYAWADELAPTLTTKCGDARIIMPDGRVYAPTPKFMGRIQGLPDNYKYPKSTTRAFTIIGNGIPTQLTKAVMGGVLDSAYEQTHNGEVLYSERDDNSVSTRSLLANALEGAAQNEIEKNKLAQYKEKIALIEAEQKKLHELREKLFTKGIKGDERRKLQDEATKTANRITTYDRQLFNLEATTALKNVLNREKELARKRQKQKDAENLKAYKEKVAETTRELLKKNRESRQKALEGRSKTEMRHKVKKVVNDLNNLLLKPTKERHIPEAMRVAVAEALAIVNMDTVDADTRVAHYNDLIAKANDPDVIASLTESRDRILEQGNKLGEKLAKLKEAYGEIEASTDDSLKSMYDDVIYSKIEKVQKDVGKTPLRNMTLEQLESVYELYKMVLTTVRDSNKAFAEDLKMTRQALGSNTFAEIKDNNKARDRIRFEGMEGFGWKNLKPMQAMKTIGSGILQKLWNNILYGQEVFAQDYDEAVKFAKEMKEKYGYNKWNLDKLYSFESKSGKVMKINLEQMMSIYAYSKRKQADEHIEFGGILLNESIIKEKKHGRTVEVKVNDSTAYRLDKMQVGEIIATLEKEFPGAKDFVDEMQKYLSDVMGEKGNEVSMKMYGIKLFKEEHYFPLKSSKDFMEAANAKLKGDVKIKNKGMTKSVVEHARNPIVLENFLDVWGNHINEMAMYHGLVLPLEDFSRTLNYGFKADDKLNTDAESVRTALHDAFGESADNYLNELLKAINGGVLHDSSDGIANKMISRFKKAKVMASLSVIVQQPTAIIRAMGIINPKYFVAQNFKHKDTWEELKKYCPTAIIKETGSFDTNMGRTIVDMIKEDDGFTDKVGDFLGKAPAYMDEVGWNMIWRALKNKVATEQKLSGEELLKECGRQMTLIINETQVYDSVMSRNELMRSKSAFTKMATSFMGEPSTVANMLYGAVLDFKRGKKGIAGKTVAAVISSVVINGLVSSLVYALRDDDEEKTWLEKYSASATTELIDGFNLLTYIPYVKDAYSLFQGYDVERTDMALIGDVVDALEDFYNVLDPEAYEDKSRGEIAKHIYENAKPLLTSICDMFGLPVGNILRDAEAIIVNDNLPMSKTSAEGTGLAIKDGWLNSSPKIVQKFVDDEKYHKLYLIANNGDSAYVKNEVAEMVAEKVDSDTTEKEAKTYVRSSFTGSYRDAYKKAFKNKDAKEMNRIRKFLYATGLWNSLSELDSLLEKWRKAAEEN